MSEAKPVLGPPMPKHVAEFIGSVLNSGADPILRAQADLLVSVETAMTDWLRRRHEAVIDTQTLLTRLRASPDPGEQVKAQQDWVLGEMRRLSADAIGCQTVARQVMERALEWLPRAAGQVAEAAAAAEAGKVPVPRPVRMPAKAE